MEHKLDALSASVDARFDTVTQALVEQRALSDVLCEELDAKIERNAADMRKRFSDVRGHLGRIGRKLDQLLDRVSLPVAPDSGTRRSATWR